MALNNHIFEFFGYKIAADRKQLEFSYRVSPHSKGPVEFTEKLDLPTPIPQGIPPYLLDSCLYNLHLILGISYWKTYYPSTIKVSNKPLSKKQAEFWNTVYEKGLGEFFYRNKIDFRNLIQFPSENVTVTVPVTVTKKMRSLVGIGGGKDSAVTVELLKERKRDMTAFYVATGSPAYAVAEMIKVMMLDKILVKRTIDPKLFKLNNTGAYNGHIPISAIHAFIGILLAVIYDYGSVVVSNEKSSNFGNVSYLGSEINHQWSKSEEFEQLFNSYISEFVTKDISFSSPLRNFSEFRIVQKFTEHKKYFPAFTSCNTNFKINPAMARQKWCGQCPKCLFVFILLGAFISRNQLIDIFHKNLFSDSELIPLYLQLLGVEGTKPFECVGTPEEVKQASLLIYKKGEFASDELMKMFSVTNLATTAS